MTTFLSTPASIPAQVSYARPVSVSLPLDPASRQWHKGTGRAIGAAANLLRSGRSDGLRMALPAQILSVVDLRVRAGSEISVSGAEAHPHIAAVVSATVELLGTGACDVQVLSVRTDTPHRPGTQQLFTEALAAVRALHAAVGVELSADTASAVVSSVLPEGSSLARPGLSIVDSRGADVSSWSWWPQYSLVRILPHAAVELDLHHSRATELRDRYASAVREQRPDLFAMVASDAALSVKGHPTSPLVEEILEVLASQKGSPLGWALSLTGADAALLFPTDMPGRTLASETARMLSTVFGASARFAVSISPKHS